MFHAWRAPECADIRVLSNRILIDHARMTRLLFLDSRWVQRCSNPAFGITGSSQFRSIRRHDDTPAEIFFLGLVTDEQAHIYGTTVKAQQTSLAAIRPGRLAEDVHAEAEDVYRSAGFGCGYRSGRGIGYSLLEAPELSKPG